MWRPFNKILYIYSCLVYVVFKVSSNMHQNIVKSGLFRFTQPADNALVMVTNCHEICIKMMK
jgi:hypothetical protein